MLLSTRRKRAQQISSIDSFQTAPYSSISFAASKISLAFLSASSAIAFGTGACFHPEAGEIHESSSSKSLSLASSCTW